VLVAVWELQQASDESDPPPPPVGAGVRHRRGYYLFTLCDSKKNSGFFASEQQSIPLRPNSVLSPAIPSDENFEDIFYFQEQTALTFD